MGSYQFKSAISPVIKVLIALAPLNALALDLNPLWNQASIAGEGANSSYFYDVKTVRSGGLQTDDIISKRTAGELTQTYEDMNREYDMRKSYRVTDIGEEYIHAQKVTDFSRKVFNEISHKQMRDNGGKLALAVKRDPNLAQMEQSAAIVGVAYAVYSGQPFDLKIADTTRFVTRTNVADSTAQIIFISPIVYTSFDYVGLAPLTRDPAASSADPNFYRDRYSVSLRRPLPILDLSTQVSYGSTSTAVTASLSRPIAPNLTAVLDSSIPTSSEIAAIVPSSETLRVLYGIRF